MAYLGAFLMLVGLAMAVAVLAVVLARGPLWQIYAGTIGALALIQVGRCLLTRNLPS